jgi:hypothetical protein
VNLDRYYTFLLKGVEEKIYGNDNSKMCGCGKVRVPAFLQKQKQQKMMQVRVQRRNMMNKPQGETTAQVRPIAPPIKKPVLNRRQMMQAKRAPANRVGMQRRQQALRKLNQMRNKRKNMNSPFDHRHYLRY